MKRKRLLIFGAAVLSLTTVWQLNVDAQTLAGTTAAVGAGAGLDAAGGGGRSPGEIAAPATSAGANVSKETQAAASAAAAQADKQLNSKGAKAEEKKVEVAPPRSESLHWDNDNGFDMLIQLVKSHGTQSSSSKRNTKSSRTAKKKSQYKIPVSSYLNWYLPADRPKVSSQVWQFVTTPNDHYYYRPWAPSMKTRNSARVIGFHSWQDAMIAGYRPDPKSWPEPATQLLYLATLTNDLRLAHYVEFVYAGQIKPNIFDKNFLYLRYVARLVNSRNDTKPYMSQTIGQVLGAALGYNKLPTVIETAAVVAQRQKEEEQRRAAQDAYFAQLEQQRERSRERFRDYVAGTMIQGRLAREAGLFD